MRLTLSALAVAGLIGFGSLAQAAPVSSSMGAGISGASEIVQVQMKRKKKKVKKAKKRMSQKAIRAKRV